VVIGSLSQAAFFLVSLFLAFSYNLSAWVGVTRLFLFRIAFGQSYPQVAVFSYRKAKGFYL
jgi:hypothetical protein